MNKRRPALIILVVGRPASGKTTIANQIAERFQLPLLAKDDFKEILFDQLGAGDRTWSVKLGRATFAILDHAVEQQLKTGSSFIVEAAFSAQYENAKFQAWQRQFGFTALQIHCVAGKDVLVRRFVERASSGSRHEGHVDSDNVEEFRTSLKDNRVETLALDGEIIEFDTTEVDAAAKVMSRIAEALAG